MNAKLYIMGKTKKTGLPNYFKKIGLSLIILVFLFGIGMKIFEIEYNNEIKKIVKIVVLNLIVIGLSFITFAKDKFEDEMTIYLKLKSIISAFVFGIIYLIIYPFFGFLFFEPLENIEINSHQLIMTILFVQIMTYYGMKKAEAK